MRDLKSLPLMILASLAVGGCYTWKSGPETVVTLKTSPGVYTNIVTRAGNVTAEIKSVGNGQSVMVLNWWPEYDRVHYYTADKSRCIMGKTTVGLMPALADKNPQNRMLASLMLPLNVMSFGIINVVALCMTPAFTYEDSGGCAEVIGIHLWNDVEDRTVIEDYTESFADVEKQQGPVRIKKFSAVVNGTRIEGTNGKALVGGLVAPGQVVPIALIDVVPPEEFRECDLLPLCGCQLVTYMPVPQEESPAEAAAGADTEYDNAVQAVNMFMGTMGAINAMQQQRHARYEARRLQKKVDRGTQRAVMPAASPNGSLASSAGETVAAGSSTRKSGVCPVCHGSKKCRPCDGTGENPAYKYIVSDKNSYPSARLSMAAANKKCKPCNGTGVCRACGGRE